MRSRASDSRLWIDRIGRGETSRRQFESARGYLPPSNANMGTAFGRTSATSVLPEGAMVPDEASVFFDVPRKAAAVPSD